MIIILLSFKKFDFFMVYSKYIWLYLIDMFVLKLTLISNVLIILILSYCFYIFLKMFFNFLIMNLIMYIFSFKFLFIENTNTLLINTCLFHSSLYCYPSAFICSIKQNDVISLLKILLILILLYFIENFKIFVLLMRDFKKILIMLFIRLVLVIVYISYIVIFHSNI